MHVTTAVEAWLRRNHFLLRRLHSLSGIIPVGAFLVVHLYTNSLAAWDARAFDKHVKEIHDIPYLPLVELLLIFLPIAFHAAYGVAIAMQGRSNAAQYWWLDNWRYTLQRVTAWIALLFLVLHLLHFRFAHWIGGPEYQATIARGMTPFDLTQWGFVDGTPLATWLWVTLYSVGLVASVFHFCNGISTFCITWGITVGDRARRHVFAGSMLLGVVLLAWGFASLYALTARPKPDLRLPPEPDARPVALSPAGGGAS